MDEQNSVLNLIGKKGRAVSNRTSSNDFGLGKIPPQALDVEEAVLGALMLEKDALSAVIDILKPDTFYSEQNQLIFMAIQDLFKESKPIDILTVTSQLRFKGDLERVGGAFRVTELTNRVGSAANIEYHARLISEKFIMRELIKTSSQVVKEAYEETSDVFDLLDNAEKNLFEISEGNLRKSYEDVGMILAKSIRQLEKLKDRKDGLSGIPSGFTNLDRVTSGWQRQNLIIIAARPGMGKTAFVTSMLRNAAVDFNIPVAMFSLEMSSVELVNRMISGEVELPSEKLKKGNLESYEWQQLNSRINPLTKAPIFIDETPALSIFELRAKCRRLKAQHDIQMVVIDYLQLMNGGGDSKRNGNREQEIATISRALKALAKELDIPVIALSQLSRAVEQRGGDKRPQLSDLRESGSIEQDADIVAFIYRPEYYKILEDVNGNSTRGVGTLIIAKNRNGALEDIDLKFIDKYAKFANLDSWGEAPADGGFNSFTLGSKINNMEGDNGKAPF